MLPTFDESGLLLYYNSEIQSPTACVILCSLLGSRLMLVVLGRVRGLWNNLKKLKYAKVIFTMIKCPNESVKPVHRSSNEWLIMAKLAVNNLRQLFF